MRIAIVIDNLSYGGSKTVCIDYINILCELGHEITVYNLTPKRREIEHRIPEGVRVVHYNFPLDASPTRYYIGIKAYRMGKYVFPFVYMIKSLGVLLRKLIFVDRKQEYDLAIAFSGHYNDMVFVDHNFVKSKKKLCWTHGALYQNFVSSDGFVDSYLKIKNIIVLNETAQEEVLAANHYLNLEKNLNIRKLHNPIRMEEKVIDREKVKKLRDMYNDFVIMVARFSYPHKDQYTVVDAMRILKEKYGLIKNVVFLGDGPEKENVEAYAKKVGMIEQCKFVGAHDDVQNYYAAAHMLVHSSIAFEGFALILVEAMHYNIPVVSTDTMVGPREVLGNDEYGLLCGVRDSSGMAEKIALLYNDKDVYANYVEAGKRRREDFSYKVIGEQLQKIISELK